MNWNQSGKMPGSGKSFEDVLQDFFDRPDFIIKLIVVIAIIAAGLTSYFTIRADEQGVVTRFGAFQYIAPEGLHFKIPFGIDRVSIVPIRVQQEEFGFSTQDPRSQEGLRLVDFQRTSAPNTYRSRAHSHESLMLTGDLNVADVQWVVQYRIVQAKDFMFNVASPIKNIRDLAQTTMRRVVGDVSINDILTIGRREVEDRAKEIMQKTADSYGMGVNIEAVNLQDVNPPEPVQPSFNLVNAALQEQKQAINRAETQYNKVIPEARGKADEQISIAEGYAIALKNRAKGDSEKFSKILAEYSKAPEVTQSRLYLESIESILRRVPDLTIIDPEVRGVLPVFGSSAQGAGSKNLISPEDGRASINYESLKEETR